jgi:hypothetical protein
MKMSTITLNNQDVVLYVSILSAWIQKVVHNLNELLLGIKRDKCFQANFSVLVFHLLHVIER